MTIKLVKKRSLCYGCCVGLMVGFLTGCGEEFADLEEFVGIVEAREPLPLRGIDFPYPVEPFIYPYPRQERDPFKAIGGPPPPPPPPLTDDGNGKDGPSCLEHPDGPKHQYRVRGLLERIPLDAFEMTGTLGPKHALVGIVKTKDGTVYKVHQGDYLGTNYGKILRISEQKIEVQERFRDKKQCWTSKVITLPLKAISGNTLQPNSPYF
jgi:type IV pilus assembly protein PilP